MCYDIQTSLIALVVNIVTSIVLFIVAKNKERDTNVSNQLKAIALFFLFVGFMQFWDILFWSYDATTKVNMYATKMAMIWNHLEPVVLALLIYLFIGKLTLPSMIMLVVYTVAIVAYSVNGWSKLRGTESTKDTCGSLYWQWNNMKGNTLVYGLFLICLLFLAQQQFTGWVRCLSMVIITSTFFFSLYKYSINASVGRFLCYFAAFCPIFFLIGIAFLEPKTSQ
jgi:hypothetical protein